MSRTYDAIERIDQIIEAKGLDPYMTRGLIGMKAGFVLAFINPDHPDDEQELQRLEKACRDILQESVL